MNLYKEGSTNPDESIFKAASDANGYIKGLINIPSYVDTLVIEPNYVGLLSHAKGIISGNEINAESVEPTDILETSPLMPQL